jgi:uncharacterized protein (DUF1499 family)
VRIVFLTHYFSTLFMVGVIWFAQVAHDKQKIIHLRSAPRVGYWDLGVNRKGMEAIRAEFGKR